MLVEDADPSSQATGWVTTVYDKDLLTQDDLMWLRSNHYRPTKSANAGDIIHQAICARNTMTKEKWKEYANSDEKWEAFTSKYLASTPGNGARLKAVLNNTFWRQYATVFTSALAGRGVVHLHDFENGMKAKLDWVSWSRRHSGPCSTIVEGILTMVYSGTGGTKKSTTETRNSYSETSGRWSKHRITTS